MTSKKLKKAALFTDIHFGKKNNSEEHNQDCLNFIQWFCDNVKADPEIDHIWFLGDWHEHRAAINAFTLQRSYHGAKMLNDLGLPIYFLVGNHDLAFRNVRTTFTTEIFDSLDNFVLLSETQVINEIHGKVLAIPYLREDEYPTLIEHKNIPVAMGHLELKGFRVSGSSNIMEHGPEAKDFFKKQTRVFTGHFHQRQTQGNIHYIGNTFPMDFSDTNDTKRGMAVYDFTTDNLKYIDWADCPKYIKASLSDVLDDPKKILVSNARVKIDVDSDITFEESNLIRERLQKKYALREITLEESYSIDVTLSEAEEEIEELKLETTHEVIQELLRRIKDDSVDTELLLKIYNKLSTSIKDINSKAASVEFLELTMQNYLSYGNDTTTVNLNFDTPTLIVGRNYDSVVDGQVDSNGAGKSTILNALLMCVFDKNLMGVDKNAQINKSNGKNMLLSTTFKVDGKYYKVERYRKNKTMGGDGVRLYANDEPVFGEEHDVTPDSVANCNDEIERILGIPYEMFIRIVVFSATHEPFLSLPSSHASKANQRDIIEELFGLTDLTLKAEKLKELLSASKAEFKNMVEVNDRLLAERERNQQQIDINTNRLEEWEENRVLREKDLLAKIAELKAIDVETSMEGFETAEALDKELNKVERKVQVLETELRNVVSIRQKAEQWEGSKVVKINRLKQEIAKIENLDFAALRAAREELATVTAEYNLEKSKIVNLRTKLSSLESNIASKIREYDKKKLEAKHLSDNKCPYCSQQYSEAKSQLEACNHAVTGLSEEIDVLAGEQSALVIEIANATTHVDLLDERRVKLTAMDIPSNLDQLEANLVSLGEQLQTAMTETNPHVLDDDALTEDEISEALEELRGSVKTLKSKIQMAREFIHPSFQTMADVQGHRGKITALEDRIRELKEDVNPFTSVIASLKATKLEELKTDRINVLDKEIKHSDFLLKLLTKKDSFIRKALLNKSIPLLNSRLRSNLDKVGLPHKVMFTEEMEVAISQFGATYEYGNFSAGQKARVNLCLAFAFRDVLQSRFGKINLCILDECLDTGLGNVGVTQAAKMIKTIATENHLSMFIISHRDEVSNMFDKRMEIELRNGFSTILDSKE